MVKTSDIANNINHVYDTIASACYRAGREPNEVTLVAVSKRKPVDDVLAALAAGVQHFGENRVEEAQEKIPLVNQAVDPQTMPAPVWHMIGHVQSRKAKQIPSLFHVIESIDSVKLAEKVSRIAVENQQTLDVLLEINISGEASKEGLMAAGWRDDAAIQAALWQETRQIADLPNLHIRGLMTMAPFVDDMQATRPVFVALRQLRDALSEHLQLPLPELSMGMTNDYPVAVEEGATMVRVGRAIFGERD